MVYKKNPSRFQNLPFFPCSTAASPLSFLSTFSHSFALPSSLFDAVLKGNRGVAKNKARKPRILSWGILSFRGLAITLSKSPGEKKREREVKNSPRFSAPAASSAARRARRRSKKGFSFSLFEKRPFVAAFPPSTISSSSPIRPFRVSFLNLSTGREWRVRELREREREFGGGEACVCLLGGSVAANKRVGQKKGGLRFFLPFFF